MRGMLMVCRWVTTPPVFLVAPAHPLMYVCARASDSNAGCPTPGLDQAEHDLVQGASVRPPIRRLLSCSWSWRECRNMATSLKNCALREDEYERSMQKLARTVVLDYAAVEGKAR